jgi:hypothetical protein
LLTSLRSVLGALVQLTGCWRSCGAFAAVIGAHAWHSLSCRSRRMGRSLPTLASRASAMPSQQSSLLRPTAEGRSSRSSRPLGASVLTTFGHCMRCWQRRKCPTRAQALLLLLLLLLLLSQEEQEWVRNGAGRAAERALR